MMCQRCTKREATEVWTEGAWAYVHGAYLRWCRRCVLEKQVEHARKIVADLPQMEAELAALDGEATMAEKHRTALAQLAALDGTIEE